MSAWPRLFHCDWSSDRRKRWLTEARWTDAGYEVLDAVPADALVAHGFQALGDGPMLVGFDFPLGLPRAWAERAGVKRFLDLLPRLGSGEWSRFFEPAAAPQEIRLHRPFFPAKAIATGKRVLADALQLELPDLLRECERPTPWRRGACELFWTLGANQAGKAAIAGWRDLLQPELANRKIRLWPFHGELQELCENACAVAAEVYPAEIYTHLGLDRNFGKRTQAGRGAQAGRILAWCRDHAVSLLPSVRARLLDGFGADRAAEDRFDSLVGVLGMIEAVHQPPSGHLPAHIRDIEGWILGLPYRGFDKA